MKYQFSLKGLRQKAWFSLGCILLFVSFILLITPDPFTNPSFFQMRAENIQGTEDPVLTQSNESQAVFDQSLVQGNSFAPLCSTDNIKIRTFADMVDEYSQVRHESQSITGKEIVEYQIEAGDTVSSVAEKFGISPETIYWANDVTAKTTLKVGQSLIILPVDGVIYFVKEGDSLSKIAHTFQVAQQDVIDFNELDGSTIFPGDPLILPGAAKPKVSTANVASSKKQYSDSTELDGYFICPVPRTNGICFKTQGLHWFNAVDFASAAGAACGLPVYAAASGEIYKVVNGGYNQGYGSYVKILHPNGVTTLYAHMGQINVSVGQQVSTGQIIGTVSNTGRTIGATGCHVHFEVGSLSGTPPRNPFR